MSTPTIFCCSSISPFKNKTLDHESKFRSFMSYAQYPKESSPSMTEPTMNASDTTYVIQVVRQINFGALESKRYFVQSGSDFTEVTEDWIVSKNFKKLNTFKNYRCGPHIKFFELNVYQKDPVNCHHWRADVARPAGEIDL